jgi:predicted glutamine amidotransferase
MCLIINKPAGFAIPEYHIRNAYANNSDGFGAMWAENGRIRVVQGLYDVDRIVKLMKTLQDKKAAIHFRFSTVGKINKENTHPFQVLNRETDGMDVWLMHNGTFSFIKSDDDHSDTWHFAQKLRPILRKIGLEALRDPRKRAAVGEKIGSYNKVLLMSGDGETITLNEKSGIKMGDVWYSNQYSLEPNYRKAKPKYVTAYGGWYDGNTDFENYGVDDYSNDDDYDNRAELYKHLWGEDGSLSRAETARREATQQKTPRRPATKMHYTPTQVRTAAGAKSTPVKVTYR